MERNTLLIRSETVDKALAKNGYKGCWPIYGTDRVEEVLRKEKLLIDGEYYIGFDRDAESLMFTKISPVKLTWYHKLAFWLLRR